MIVTASVAPTRPCVSARSGWARFATGVGATVLVFVVAALTVAHGVFVVLVWPALQTGSAEEAPVADAHPTSAARNIKASACRVLISDDHSNGFGDDATHGLNKGLSWCF